MSNKYKSKFMHALLFAGLFALLAGCKADNPVLDGPDPNWSGANEILSFEFTGYDKYPDYTAGDASVATIDNENSTIKVVTPWYSSTVLTPEITISDGATVSPISGSVRDFADENGVVYTVKAENGEKREWRVFMEIPDKPEPGWGPDPREPLEETGDYSIHAIPLYANSYTTGSVTTSSRYGLNCTTTDGVYSIYFTARYKGKLQFALKGTSGSTDGNSFNVKVYVNGELAHCDGTDYDHTYVYDRTGGNDTITLHRVELPEVLDGHAGNSVRLDIQAVGDRKGSYYFRFPELWVSGWATRGTGGYQNGGLNYVPSDNDHFGRRGPSVHFTPTKPDGDMEYFYSEVTVPEGSDVIGSYFMCNGFGQGYAGIQVNSATERRVLFSVWSPYETDNPALMGKYAPKLVRVNNQPKYRDNFQYGTFGNEGSGGQSYLRLNWEAGKTYKMLTRVRPHPQPDKFPNSSLYKCWFHNGEEWIFIAEWRRVELDPEDNNGREPTPNWYTGAYHFLENFSVNTGNQERYGTWDNQWFVGSNGTFHEPTEYRFTYDSTGSGGHRVDYDGAVMEDGLYAGSVYLRMGGYFTDNQPETNLMFTKPAKNNRPAIDLAALNAMGTDDPAEDNAIDQGERYQE